MMAPGPLTPEVNGCRVESEMKLSTVGCCLERWTHASVVFMHTASMMQPLLFGTVCLLQNVYNREQRTCLKTSVKHN